MDITVNGEKREFDSPLMVTALLDALGLSEEMVLGEQNRHVVPKNEMAKTPVSDGDVIEIFRMAGSG